MKSHIDIENVERLTNIAKVYYKEQEVSILKLEELFDDFANMFDCSFSSKLIETQNDILSNIKSLSTNSLNYIKALDKVHTDYEMIKMHIINNEPTQRIKKVDIDI